jgi:pullulanase/glycogen debranching enzyme
VRPWPGSPYPLGATFDGAGTNFALFSEVAEAVDLCLFDGGGKFGTGPSIGLGRTARGQDTRSGLAGTPVQILNVLGAEGWEVVAAFHEENRFEYVLKRDIA